MGQPRIRLAVIILIAACLSGGMAALSRATETNQLVLDPVAQLGGPPSAVAASGSILLVGVKRHLLVLDVSDWRVPRVIGQSELWPHGTLGLRVGNGYAVTYPWIVDLSDIGRPTLVSIVPGLGGYGFELRDDWLYYTNSRDLKVVDLSNLRNPRLVGELRQLEERYADMAVVGQRVFFAVSGGATVYRVCA